MIDHWPCIHRLQSSSNTSPVKTSHRWTTTTTLKCSPRHQRLSDSNSQHIGRTSSNVETRSSSKPEVVAALQSRRVRSCEYDGGGSSTTVTSSVTSSVAERLRQLPRVRAARATSRTKPATVVLLPPPPPQRPASDKVPRYNDTGSFEEVDERLLMMEDFHVDRSNSHLPTARPGQQTRAN